MFNPGIKDFEGEFDAKTYIDRLTFTTPGGGINDEDDSFDPSLLHERFIRAIEDMKLLQEKTEKKLEKLEEVSRKESTDHVKRVGGLLHNCNEISAQHFEELNGRIKHVSSKVVPLGTQLERANIPRTKCAEAYNIIKQFDGFVKGNIDDELFNKTNNLKKAAPVIQMLKSISEDLCEKSERFNCVDSSITETYHAIETGLIEEFQRAHADDDKPGMREIATVLQHFKGYNQCVVEFINQSLKDQIITTDGFSEIVPQCCELRDLIHKVFSNPEFVLENLLVHIFLSRIRQHVEKLDRSNLGSYLRQLCILFSETSALSQQLIICQLSNDTEFLARLQKNIFHRKIATYISDELEFLNRTCSAILAHYYASIGHTKRQLTGLKNAILNKAMTKQSHDAPINYSSLLSRDSVVAKILRETEESFNRCDILSPQSDIPKNAVDIHDILLQYLVVEHLEYAIDMATQGLPPVEPKSQPSLHYLDVVNRSDKIFHEIEKQYVEKFQPLVLGSLLYSDAVTKRKELIASLESKLESGLDRTLNSVVGWVKHILQTEQRKSDYKPEGEDCALVEITPACKKTVHFLNMVIKSCKSSLDGGNLLVTCEELGSRLHSLIYNHLLQYQYTGIGGMQAMFDVNEYCQCISGMNNPLVSTLFDKLRALCNLLVVGPDNIKEMMTAELLADIDKSVKNLFIQQRSDYKSSKLNQLATS